MKPKENDLLVIIIGGYTLVGKVSKVYVDGSITLQECFACVEYDYKTTNRYQFAKYNPMSIDNTYTFSPYAYTTFFYPNKAAVEDYLHSVHGPVTGGGLN